MHTLAALAGALLIIAVLAEGFSTFVQARRNQAAMLTRHFYRGTWRPYAALGRRIRDGRRRESFLAVYGPLSLILLLGCFAAGLVFAFGLLHWAVGLRVQGALASLPRAFFFSGTSLFTIGSDVPENSASKVLMVVESGMGLGFLGLLVAYLPVLYQAYSSLELRIALMDSRAGSPPSAAELLRRHGRSAARLESHLGTCEVWSAELLQHQLSFPMLGYFRSQHMNESWLASLTTSVDVSAITMLCSDDDLRRQAEATFAMGRHTLVDLARMFGGRPRQNPPDRLPPEEFARLCAVLAAGDAPIDVHRLHEPELNHLRNLYEPYADVLSLHFLAALPRWVRSQREAENWLRTGWEVPADYFAISDPFQK